MTNKLLSTHCNYCISNPLNKKGLYIDTCFLGVAGRSFPPPKGSHWIDKLRQGYRWHVQGSIRLQTNGSGDLPKDPFQVV